ncbi:dual specificity protein phosphatase 16 [Centroberyx affinis]|uniref:dual specificity protein phosphatase 16 n=1 Tax=Centroberyx affinis TaxID=166261 RepID=UPI003A5BF1A5
MVLSREREAERPQLSVILPRLYLGAESDVTQDRLAALGISYVLSVSRCSPQPSFLPRSRYLRIPIDDSLRDDLLPWIPQALRFIDAAMSSGASVLVHCAAGISRSPALAVAYIMYSLGMDLDHAYRFVKERRPSISPNFNFLGQLQHFQATLSQKTSDGNLVIRPLKPLGTRLPSASDSVSPPDSDQSVNYQANRVTNDSAEAERAHGENLYNTDKVEQRYSRSGECGNPRPLTLSLSGNLQTLDLTINQNQKEVQTPCEAPALSPCEPAKPTLQLQLPAGSASLLDKRKSLTLSLSPLGSCPLTSPTSSSSSSQLTGSSATSKTVHKREMGVRHEGMSQSDRLPAGGTASSQEAQREWSSSHSKYARPTPGRPEAEQQGVPSPLSLTLNKLLGWGERMLLGGLLAPPVRMGQAVLPYRC